MLHLSYNVPWLLFKAYGFWVLLVLHKLTFLVQEMFVLNPKNDYLLSNYDEEKMFFFVIDHVFKNRIMESLNSHFSWFLCLKGQECSWSYLLDYNMEWNILILILNVCLEFGWKHEKWTNRAKVKVLPRTAFFTQFF